MPGPTDLLTAANPYSAAAGVGLGLAQTVVGLVNAGKTKREAKEIAKSRPQYDISPLAGQDLSLAESELAGGMSARAETAYNQNTDRDFAASLAATLKGGGSVNNVGDIFDRSQAGRMRLAEMQDQLRLKQIDNVVRARRYMDEQTDKEYQINKYAPWKDRQVANAKAREDANNMIWSGLSTATGGAMNFLSNKTSNPGNNVDNGEDYSRTPNRGLLETNLPNPNDTGNRPTPRSSPYSDLTDNNYNFDFLNDPMWWQGGHDMFGG